MACLNRLRALSPSDAAFDRKLRCARRRAELQGRPKLAAYFAKLINKLHSPPPEAIPAGELIRRERAYVADPRLNPARRKREWDYFGNRPRCRLPGEHVNVHRSHWVLCIGCKTRWAIGANLFSSWHDETEELWRANAERLSQCTEVEPLHPLKVRVGYVVRRARHWVRAKLHGVPNALWTRQVPPDIPF